ncbi:FAD:protein FMN transferase [Methylobacillus arboreus]|uniref:FAD:protein FMN transferase n=1 Tax=Methylobacillus arboreus TaxID=755170 RepID=UPI001E573A97|nr:FAD:protein FMN transferase [Methylobacillus arboreus]MCB5191202.1 FAD:protein FMN transferase [Methylobacillus arboreus]
MRQVIIPQQLADLPRELPSGNIVALSGQTMGTTWSVRYINLPGLPKVAVASAIETALDQVVQQMSTWLQGSVINQFNHAEPGTVLPVPWEFSAVLSKALAVASQTDGCFDPTVGTLVDLWGFGPQQGRELPPAPESVEAALLDSGWKKLQFDPVRSELKQSGRLTLDFSGIAKGFGVDQVAAALRQSGLQHYLVEVGGEFYGYGVKPDGQPWWVALERTPDAAMLDEYIVAAHGLGLATSGDYRRYFEHEGRHYAHTINPATGWPVAEAPVSVSVLASSCMEADAFATALTVMGLERGLAFARTHELAALFTVHAQDELVQRASPRLQEMLQ